MIKFFVRTTGKRILDKSYSQINYELLIDTNNNSQKAFIQQLDIIEQQDCVVLEDDLILCNNFLEKITQIITNNKDEIITFFHLYYYPEYLHEQHFGNLTQCIYYPKEKSHLLKETILKNNIDIPSVGRTLTEFYKLTNSYFLLSAPYLVQHIDDYSLM